MTGKLTRWMIDGAAMFAVAVASLLLLLYVGFGDGKRVFELIHIEKLTAQGLYLQSSIEKFVRDGLPLKQYAGFTTVAAPILEGADVDGVLVYDPTGKKIFTAVDKGGAVFPDNLPSIDFGHDLIRVFHGSTHYQVALPLRSRFETVGSVVVFAPNALVNQRLYDSFLPLAYFVAGLSALFAVLVLIAKPYFSRSKKPWLQISYAATFVLMAILVVATLISLYFDGVQDKARASAFTLSQRLNDIVEFKLNFKDFDGIDRAFQEYRTLNKDISEAALTIDKSIEITSDASRVGKAWVADSGKFEYRIDLSPADQPQYTSLAVTILKSVVFERVARSVKNFAALFIASAFLSGLFLQVAASMQRMQKPAQAVAEDKAAMSDAALVIIKPVFFLAVFLDSLTYSFLPKFMQSAATTQGFSTGFASAPFTAYYLCFALSLIPAGVLADRRGPKQVIVLGLLLAAGSLVGMILPLGIWELTLLRGLSGIGQGLLLIGVQNFILAVSTPEKKTQGAAIIVFGFQGGLISGMALGSLFVTFLDTAGVFAISGGVGFATIVYSLLLVPATERKQATTTVGASVKKLTDDLKKVIANLEFLKILLCIGAPAKAILTGVITFALPLILGQQGYRSEDIGQLIMLYGLGVVASSGYVSRLVDRTKNTELVLFIGAVISGIGLFLIGFMGSPQIGNGLLSTVIAIFAVLMVGLAHGFINAPVTTHVGLTELAKHVGANQAMTAYRFLERGGHVAGPILISQLFLIWGQGAPVIGAIGLVVMVLSVVFIAHRFKPQAAALRGEPAE